MTPRQAQVGADVFTALVIASVALALATFTWRLQGSAGVGPAAAPVSPGGARAIDLAPIMALAPFGTASALPASGDQGSLQIRAIFAAVPMEGSSVLIAGSDGTVNSYGIGASVGGGVIEQILPEQVVLRTAGGLQTLSIGLVGDGQGQSATKAASTPTTTSNPVAPSPPPAAAPQGAPPQGVNSIRKLIPESARDQDSPQPSPAPAAPPVSAAQIPLPQGSSTPSSTIRARLAARLSLAPTML